MALSEIEKLERRYADNPQGLTFAPLAEVHRKNGDVARALELLRAGLTPHPDYIPASIVLGRCHLDLGDLPAAEAAFTHVLGLDGENVIALKALADITERHGRFDEAERWLRTLLAIDRSNDEARDQLGRVEASRRQTESAAIVLAPDDRSGEEAASPVSPVPGAEAIPEGRESSAAEASGAEAAGDEPGFAAPASVSPPPMPAAPRDPMLAWVAESGSAEADEAVPLDLEELHTTADFDGPRPEGIELEQPVLLEETVQPLAGLVGRDQRSEDDAAPRTSGEFRVEMAEDIVLTSSGGSEFQMANASEELLRAREAREGERDVPPPSQQPEPTPEPMLEPMPEPVAERTVAPPEPAWSEPAWSEPATPHANVATESPAEWAAPVAEPPQGQPEPDLVVTESMAELLLQQGHPLDALTVYRHLHTRSGGAPRFQEKIAELEGLTAQAGPAPAAPEAVAPEAPAPELGASEPRGQLTEAPATEVPAPAATAPSYSVVETHGQSVQSFLRGVFAARPAPGTAGAASPAREARPPASEPEGAPTRPAHDSLSLSSVFGEESTPTHPAVPAGGSGAPSGGVSYDEFFGSAGTVGAPRSARGNEPKSDDLDQFHAWLQNLKR